MNCPIPAHRYDQIVMGHGGGGKLSADLLQSLFLPHFRHPTLGALEDQATLALPAGRVAFTTDSYVVRPLFFPGGDIGKLAIFGTVNDLAVGGALPLYLAAAFILEEGLPLATLEAVVRSMRAACDEAEVELVTGDTKVVERGKGDQVFITTTGIGVVPNHTNLSIANAKPGDAILVSGTIGDHGMAILSVREGLAFETELHSDCAPLTSLVQSLLAACPETRAIRDPTRGGVASTVNELAQSSGAGVSLDERQLPVRREVRAACELLGLDPLYVANEGKLIAVVPENTVAVALAALREHPLGRNAAQIGVVTAAHPKAVTIRSQAGGIRLVPLLSGEQLPRIC